jgi:hypothetical protein
MTGYDMPLAGVRSRRVYYQGALWIHCRDNGSFWGHGENQWTNVRQGLDGIPRNWDRRLLLNTLERS